MSEADVDDDVFELSIVEPDSFTAARNARAKELRAAKEKDRAAVVAKLTKPTWTAWALNVLARQHPDEIEAWLAAGDALDAALSKGLDGDREALREAQQGERAALAHVVERASAVLTGAGRRADDQTQQRFTGTLRAAVTDAEVRAELTRGVLADDVEAPSFGFGFGVPDDGNVVSMASARRAKATKAKASAAKATKATKKKAAGRGEADESDDGEDEADRLAREEAEAAAEEERVAAEERAAEVARLQAEVDRCQAEADQREGERARLRAAADEAEAAATEAADRAEAAERALAEARAALAELDAEDE